MSIAQRLYLQIIATVLTLSVIVGFGIVQMDRVYTTTNFTNVNVVPSFLDLESAFRASALVRVKIWQYMAVSDPAKRAEIGKAIDDGHAKLVAALNKYEKDDVADDRDRALLAADVGAVRDFDALREKIMAMIRDNRVEEARDFLLSQQAVMAKVADAFEAHGRYNEEIGKKSALDAAAMIRQANTLSIAIALVAVAGIAALGIVIVRKLVRSLAEAVRIAETVAAGDLTSTIVVTSNDETGQLMKALKTMNESLVLIVGQVRSGTDTISTASSQIATGNLDLSSRTEQQASSLEETASSMEELTSTVRQNADNARQANALASAASDVAIQGGDVVAQVVGTMNAINESSRKIVDIIGVIDGIAFQTNILALNAAVEAARAGEQGRGFAVVASEVRNLAQRSATAAREIKALIHDSVEKVDAGSKLADRAGATMRDVVDSVHRVTGIIGAITLASQEQSSGIEQINHAITQMDQVTQQNAALVEEAAAAAGSLQDQAGSLAEVVRAFRLADILGGARRPQGALAGRYAAILQ